MRSTGVRRGTEFAMVIDVAVAVAFALTGVPSIGEFQPAIILARYGERGGLRHYFSFGVAKSAVSRRHGRRTGAGEHTHDLRA